ncbi:hypothetical protein PAECIP111893_02773 [Paenibacillus plantiphilus]|uniref:Uncharacterized protein n=1 Tax=Paenibacillus plantiphilus TaxID=2905650 RepID=A0ABM9CAW4_9BACL|nr:hypothetical protein PAECIP111893_02773 [Paenibacillus plantiphilus]
MIESTMNLPLLSRRWVFEKQINSGFRCLVMIANYHELPTEEERIKHSYAASDDGIKVNRYAASSLRAGG